jgi:Ca2+-binding RTX toxin-like protein
MKRSPAPLAITDPARRRAGRLLLSAAAVGAAPALMLNSARAQIKRGDTLTVGIWGGAQERITREHCAKPLEEKYGVKINFVLGGTPDRRARAYAERGRPSFDVLYLNIFESRQAVKDGVTQAPTAAVPQYANLYDIARVGGYGVAFNPVTVVYDKEVITRPMTSWADFWRPDVKGRIAWPSYPGAQGTAALLMTAKVFGGSENDSLQGNAGIDILNGGDGNDTLNDGGTLELTFSIGGNGNDTIIGTSGQDQMWGGTGSLDTGADVFQFGAGNGFDIIFDFQAGAGVVDQIRLLGTGIASFAQLQAENRIGQAGANTQINLVGAGNVIFLINTTATTLVADDFLFV